MKRRAHENIAAPPTLCYNTRIRALVGLPRRLFALQSIIETIQMIARQRGRGDTSPLIMVRPIESTPGERISHLPIESELAQAWVALTGEPFRPHQAQALMALRRGEPVALCAANPDAAMTTYLLLYTTLLVNPQATAFILAHDEADASTIRGRIERLNLELPYRMRLPPTHVAPDRRPDPYARLVIATPETLHGRMLRHHDRGWRLFWPRLQYVLIHDLHRYQGVAGAHLADLLLRLQRIVSHQTGGVLPNLIATIAHVIAPELALAGMLHQPWRIIAADDGPQAATVFAVWRGTAGRLREASEIATAIRRQGYHVHIVCSALETAQLAPIVDDIQGISYGPNTPTTHILIAAGYPDSQSALRRLLYAGYQAVILVLGELPHEQTLARLADTLTTDLTSYWPPSGNNAYVTAQHVLCAASEQPLTQDEVELWGAQDIVARLVTQEHLVDLPDPEIAWKPTDKAGDPYLDFSLLSSSGPAIVARTEQSQTIALLDPTGFERWTFPGAALPPGVGGWRVLARDEDAGNVTLRLESNGRRSYPLRRCQVSLREERTARMLTGGNHAIGWGRVVIDEEIYGYRESTSASAPTDIALQPPLKARWIAPACWFDIATNLQVLGQMIGWNLAAALSLHTTTTFTDIVPCYDHETRRVYIIDAQPGGNGLATWIYDHAEELLPLAYDIALTCRHDPLLEPLSRVDMDWLLALLGRTTEELNVRERQRTEAPTRLSIHLEPTPRPVPIETPPALLLPPTTTEPNLKRPLAEPTPKPRAPRAADERRPEPTPRAPEPPSTPRTSRAADERRVEPTPRIKTTRSDSPPPRTASIRHATHTPIETPPPPAPTPPPTPARTTSNDPTPPTRRPAPQPTPTPRAERSRDRTPKTLPTTPTPQPPQETSAPPPDPEALIARLRHQREQREAQQARKQEPTKRTPMPTNVPTREPIEPRFAAGEHVFCLPYGNGIVRTSTIEDNREILNVLFPEHGELSINPAISLVRKINEPLEDNDDLL